MSTSDAEGTSGVEGLPAPGMELTLLLVVGDLVRSRRFYVDVLGATVYREYGGTSCVLQFLGGRGCCS